MKFTAKVNHNIKTNQFNIMINKYGEATINSVFIEDIIEVLEIYYIVKHIHREDFVNLVRDNSFEDIMKLYKEMR